MRSFFSALCLLLIFGFLASDALAQRRRTPRRPDGFADDKNVFEVFGRLKAVRTDVKGFAVDIVDPKKPAEVIEVAAFQITGETIFRAIEEGKTLADYPAGTPLFIVYRTTTDKDYKGTALVVRRVLREVPDIDTKPAPKPTE